MTALAALAALRLAAHPAQAQIILSGNYSNTGDGYVTAAGQSYLVTPTATFDNDSYEGLYVKYNDPVTINGGDFSNDVNAGIYINGGSAIINGGTFNDPGGNNSGVAIFTQSADSVASIYGGTFSGPSNFTAYGGTITIYGTFIRYGAITQTGSGSVTGTLADGGSLQTFTYYNNAGEIIFDHAPAAVPEASTTVSFGLLLALGLGGVVLARKKRAVA